MKHVLILLNKFLKDDEALLQGERVDIDFLKGRKSSFMSGLFSENRLIGML